jgi:hypothetical protein
VQNCCDAFTNHPSASPQILNHTGHTSAAPPADSVSTTPIAHTAGADNALFAKKSLSQAAKVAPGITIEAGADPKPQEIKVGNELVAEGREVTVLAPSSVGRRADFLVDGKLTELKTVSNAKEGQAASALRSKIKEATKQADRVIIDARDQRGLTKPSALRATEDAVGQLPNSQIKEVRVLGREGNAPYDFTVNK